MVVVRRTRGELYRLAELDSASSTMPSLASFRISRAPSSIPRILGHDDLAAMGAEAAGDESTSEDITDKA